MRKSLPVFTFLLTSVAIVFSGCTDEPDREVKATPVGSVLTGETTNAEGYLDKVKEGNEARQQEQEYVSPFDREEPGRGALNERY